MASLLDVTIESWRPASGRDADAARLIGTRKATPAGHTATLVEVHEGRVRYGLEIPMFVSAAEVIDLPVEIEARLGLPRMHAWLFRVSPTSEVGPLKDYCVIFSALPHSQNRHFIAKLRPSRHRPVSEINRQLVSAIELVANAADPEYRLQRVLDGMAYTPFQSDPRSLAAWMVYPRRYAGFRRPRADKDRDYAIGICAEPERCIEFLKIDPLVEELFAWTDNDTLFAGWPDGGRGPAGPVARRVSDTAKANKSLALDVAATLALAGPVSHDLMAGSDPAKRLAIRQVERIYRDVIYRWSAYPLEIETDDYLYNVRAVLAERDLNETLTQLVERAHVTPEDDLAFARLLIALPPTIRLPEPLASHLRAAFPYFLPESPSSRLARRRLLDHYRQPTPEGAQQ